MTKDRDLLDGKKLAIVTVRLSEREELLLLRASEATGVQKATLLRILAVRGLKRMTISSIEDLLEDNQSSSDFAPLS